MSFRLLRRRFERSPRNGRGRQFNNRNKTIGKERLAAFSDGVIAIIITIMVLELKAPPEEGWNALRPLLPVFLSYVLSFVYVAIYWNNHHHLFAVTERVNGAILWANMHLLFWLSMIPFVTAWQGEHLFAPVPTAVYGMVLLAAALAYWLLQGRILTAQGPNSALRAAVGRDIKGKLSPLLYALAIFVSFTHPGIADSVYVAVALMWLIPDRRIERMVSNPPGDAEARGA